MSSTKGNRRERQAAELYEQAGYVVYSPPRTKYGETDIFNLFDLLCLREDDVQLVQVKSNGARGWQQWSADVADLPANPAVSAYMLVCHDAEGWRLIGMKDGSKHVWVDERDSTKNMGEGLVSWLQDNTG